MSRIGAGRATRACALDTLAQDRLGAGKVDDLWRLARAHGGYDRIPLDDRAYRA